MKHEFSLIKGTELIITYIQQYFAISHIQNLLQLKAGNLLFLMKAFKQGSFKIKMRLIYMQ